MFMKCFSKGFKIDAFFLVSHLGAKFIRYFAKEWRLNKNFAVFAFPGLRFVQRGCFIELEGANQK